jgi:hypothetical protein
MKTTERFRAQQVAAAVEQLQSSTVEPGSTGCHFCDGVDPADAGLLDTARRLAQLPTLLGPVSPELEQTVMRRVRTRCWQSRGWRITSVSVWEQLRKGWVAAGLVAIVLTLLWLSPPGQTAVASFLAIVSLGRSEVAIAPIDDLDAATDAAKGSSAQEVLTLAQAEAQMPFTIPQPAYLPPNYTLEGVHSTHFQELPAWIPQPLFVELVYGDGLGHEVTLRLYRTALGNRASIAKLDLRAAPIRDVVDVKIGSRPGALLQLGTERSGVTWQEVVWERDDMILALSAADLAQEELLRIARSVR